MVYNTWQRVHFGLLGDPNFDIIDDEAPGSEDLGARQIRMRRLYAELESDLHGPDHRAQALLAVQDRRARETAQAEADATEGQGPSRLAVQTLTDRPPAYGMTENTEHFDLDTPKAPLEDARRENDEDYDSGSDDQ